MITGMELSFRQFHQIRAGLIADLLDSIYQGFPWKNNEQSENRQYWKELDRTVSSYQNDDFANGFLTYCDDTPVGVCFWRRLDDSTAKLLDNGVLPGFRGRKIGLRQVEKAIEILRSRSCKLIRVTTGDNAFHRSASRTYLSCGFVEVNRLEKYGNRIIEYELRLKNT